MNIFDHQPKRKSCPKHNQPILLYNTNPEIGACCLICLQNLPVLAEQLNDQQKEIYNKAKQQIDINHQQMQSLLDALLNQYNQYFAQQVLKEHIASVYCIIMNKRENQIISGSADSTLKIWTKGRGLCSQSIGTIYEVFDMSLNEEEDILTIIFQSFAFQILFLQKDQNWIISQKCTLSQSSRTCSTLQDQFVLSDNLYNGLKIYDYNEFQQRSSLEYFKECESIQKQFSFDLYCNLFFPCQVLRSPKILTLYLISS